jgi:hypothetical protein
MIACGNEIGSTVDTAQHGRKIAVSQAIGRVPSLYSDGRPKVEPDQFN